jgi:hypothetical protein
MQYLCAEMEDNSSNSKINDIHIKDEKSYIALLKDR